jgi:hypothetical protein
MSSLEDIHANRLASLDNETEQKIRGIYGPNTLEPLAFYDPELRSWRMSGVITLWGLTVSLETLPTSGMTQSGRLFRRSPWVRHIAGSGSSAWPTPTTQEVEHPDLTLTETGRRMSLDGLTSHSLNLADAVRMWPTPTASSWGSTNHRMMLDLLVKSGEITQQDKQQMTSGNGGRLNPMWVEWLMGFPLGWTDLEDSATQ